MNIKHWLIIGATPLGFLLEFLAYFFGSLAATSSSGIGFLYFCWSALSFFGGLASWALVGFLFLLLVNEEKANAARTKDS